MSSDIKVNPDPSTPRDAEEEPPISSKFPIDLLPNELLSNIFHLGYLSTNRSSRLSSAIQFTLLLCQTTQRWRQVALSTPQLWTRLHISTINTSHAEMTTIYLRRSGALPMLFSVDLSLHGLSEPQRITSELVKIMAAHIHRCCQLQIIWDIYDEFRQFAEGVRHLRAPILQSIHVREDATGSIPGHKPSMRVFEGGAPSLQSFKTRGVNLGAFLPPLESAMSVELHEYYLSDVGPWTDFKDMLGGLPALTRLIINGDIISSWPSHSNAISLPALTNLRVRASSDGTSSHFPLLLNAISCPLLQDLFVEMVIVSEMKEYLQLTSLTPKFPLLRSLTFFPPLSSHLDEPLWVYMAKAFPDITHLTYCLSYENMIFSFLGGNLNPSQFPPEFQWPNVLPWPNLETLTLINRYKYQTSPLKDLRQVASARASLDHPLRKVQLPQTLLHELQVPSDWLRDEVTVEACSSYSHLNADNYDIEWSSDED